MPDDHESNSQMQISSEDIETLENIVQKYTSRSISKPNAIASLAIEIGKIATRLGIVPSESLIQPYVDEIEAFDRENREAEERGNRGSSNQRHEDEREQGGEYDGETRARMEQETDARREAPREPEQEEIRGSRRARSEAEEHEDAEVSGSRKRTKADVGKYKWNDADSFLESIFTLTPAHQTVREQVRNYAADIKESLRDLETAFGKPFLPNSQWKNILLNRYCDLDEIATNIYSFDPKSSYMTAPYESTLAVDTTFSSTNSTNLPTSPCRFRHVCIDCGKPGHTATKCPRRGKTAA
ncbi:protein [Lentinula edodes]|uniref:Protein n=1 Tax=Lentinula edodes TaxID=5353 RepID=A0A1Q3ERJ8_LENED|nr:protein [Lentinula edodes]